jgi:hypothetical protein
LIAILIHVQTKFPSLVHIECQVGSVHLERVVAVKVADPEKQRPRGQSKLGDVISQVKKGQTGFRPQPDGSGSNLHFRARVAIHPQIVSRGQRPIRRCFQPVSLAARLEGNRSLNKADATSAGRWILLVILRQSRWHNWQHRPDCRKHCNEKSSAHIHVVFPYCGFRAARLFLFSYDLIRTDFLVILIKHIPKTQVPYGQQGTPPKVKW